jgi:hypothetical protein
MSIRWMRRARPEANLHAACAEGPSRRRGSQLRFGVRLARGDAATVAGEAMNVVSACVGARMGRGRPSTSSYKRAAGAGDFAARRST